MGAVFLALALGILIGVSFGDSILVANQRGIIELMEEQLSRLKELNGLQEKELQRWDKEIKPLVGRSFSEALAAKRIILFVRCAAEAEQIRTLLEENGAELTVVSVAPQNAGGADQGRPPADAAALLHLLSLPEGVAAAGLEAPGLEIRLEESGAPEQPPDCCLILFPGEGGSSCSFLGELWRELHEKGVRVIALLPWREKSGEEHLPAMDPEPSLVDNIDTYWGQLALLIMLAGDARGHYGFDSAGKGLLPAAAGGD